MCRRGLIRVPIRRVSDLLVCLCWKSDSSSSCHHGESFRASHVVIVVSSIVVVIILGGARLVSTLPLLHVCLVQAPSARVGVLLAAG